MKKLLICVSTGCLLVVGSFTVPQLNPTVAEAATVRYADTTAAVNFRTAPSTSSKVLGVLKTGTRVEVLEVVNNSWVKVNYKNNKGYVSTKFLKEVTSNSSNSSTNSSSKPTSSQSQAGTADKIISAGQKYLGTKYQYGAKAGQTSTFDCSSFVQFLYKQQGIDLPRSSRSQAKVGTSVTVSNLQKGDLIFFKTGGGSQIDHVAIYMGDGKILHTIPKGGVQVSSFSGFWKKTAVSAKRVL